VKPWMVGSLAVVVFGCGGGPEEERIEPPPGESQIVADYKRELGLDFLRCPKMIHVPRPPGPCSDALREAGQCFVDAFTSCTPAHVSTLHYVDDGWYVSDFLVVPAGETCSVVHFSDTTHAKRDCRTVSRTTCDRVKLEDGEGGCGLRSLGTCGEEVELVADPRPFCSKGG